MIHTHRAPYTRCVLPPAFANPSCSTAGRGSPPYGARAVHPCTRCCRGPVDDALPASAGAEASALDACACVWWCVYFPGNMAACCSTVRHTRTPPTRLLSAPATPLAHVPLPADRTEACGGVGTGSHGARGLRALHRLQGAGPVLCVLARGDASADHDCTPPPRLRTRRPEHGGHAHAGPGASDGGGGSRASHASARYWCDWCAPPPRIPRAIAHLPTRALRHRNTPSTRRDAPTLMLLSLCAPSLPLCTGGAPAAPPAFTTLGSTHGMAQRGWAPKLPCADDIPRASSAIHAGTLIGLRGLRAPCAGVRARLGRWGMGA